MKSDGTSCPSRVDGFSAAILAGGESRRFGRDKAQAVLGGRPLVAHVLEPLQRLCEDVTIITNHPVDYECFGVDVATDILPGAGALGGLLTALVHTKCDPCLVVACDMPFLNERVIRKMFECDGRQDVLVPLWKNEPQPLHAFYSKRCIPFIRKRIEQRDFRIIDFYPDVSVQRIEEGLWKALDPDCLSFFNVNTSREFEEAERRLEKTLAPS